MQQLMQENASYIIMALIIAWLLWKRLIAPKLSGVKSISATDYQQLCKTSHVLLDVRQSGEWAKAHPAPAIHMPLSEISQRMQELDKQTPIVVICASGNRSAMAATKLANTGFDTVYNFSGGMGAWQAAGLTVKSGT
ncbi:rhodanese-like domain-containing protein [Mariprofundus ferrooxydans]|nr:rhodanese-like domain-containing protein [Mariprofundus ferrooxydans]